MNMLINQDLLFNTSIFQTFDWFQTVHKFYMPMWCEVLLLFISLVVYFVLACNLCYQAQYYFVQRHVYPAAFLFNKFFITTVNELHFIWTASSEFGTYRLCEQRRFRRACASAQSRQNLRCSLIQAVNQEERSDRKPDPWPLWMAGHAQLKFVMTECSKTEIRLTELILCCIIFQILQVHLRFSSPLTLTLETSTGFRTSTENGEPGTSLSIYSTFTLWVPISVGL